MNKLPAYNHNKGCHYKRPSRPKRSINPEAQREYLLRTKYGLTAADYNSMVEAQQHKCAICKCEAPLQVDHCHKSGKVRELLCNNCNGGIGIFRENIEAMQRAIEYIKKHSPWPL